MAGREQRAAEGPAAAAAWAWRTAPSESRTVPVTGVFRNAIWVHLLQARRDPTSHPMRTGGPFSREMAQKWGVRGQKTKDRRPMPGEVRTDLPPHAMAGLLNAWRGSVRRQTSFAQSPTSDLRPTPLPPRLLWLTSWRSEQSDARTRRTSERDDNRDSPVSLPQRLSQQRPTMGDYTPGTRPCQARPRCGKPPAVHAAPARSDALAGSRATCSAGTLCAAARAQVQLKSGARSCREHRYRRRGFEGLV